jgi:murein DD-endopeptidase MepM/ murein hydrolase activator NlpD
VDRYGCSALDFLGAPEGVLDPERGQVGRVVDQLLADGSFAKLVNPLNLQLAPSNHPGLFLRERRLGDATQGQSNWVEELRQTLSEFRRMKPQRVAELLRRATKLDPEHADVRPEDFELERLDAIELGLVESLAESERSLMTLSNLVNAAGVRPTRQRVRLLSLDEARGIALLEGGRTMLLPKPGLPGAPPLQLIRGAFSQGAELDVDVSSLPDGSLFGHTAEPVLQVSSNLVWQLDPRCLRIKVVPANPGLPDFDTGVRHHLRAYKWGFTENLSFHYLEFGMALAVDKINCVLETPDAYKHWVKILVDRDGDGVFSTLVQSLSDTSPPFVLKPSDLPEFRPMPFIVREFRAPMQNGVVNGPSEVVGEETFIIEVNDYAYYGEAFYDRTIFEIRDAPNATGWQAARVTIVGRSFPLTLQAANQQTFRASSYKVSGNSSSYPNVLPIGLNEPFAVRFQDPNETLFFAHPDDVGRGLYGPTLSGFNHGRAFTYRVRLPKLVRDRLYDCAGLPDTYYRIPFLGPMGGGVYGTWRVSQGNNGTFTHNGWQRYAFDFPKPQGLQILAARGGLVDDLRESGSQSCWNPNFDNGDGTTGACVGCSGSKAGNFVKILHQDGTYGVYFHFQVNGVTVTKGQRVYRGDPLGYVGTTGCSTGPHLHFHVVNAAQTETIPIRFEAYDDDFDFRQCLLPASNSEGFSTNEPWWWPF